VDNLSELNSDPEVRRYITGGKPTPREEIRDNIIPYNLDFIASQDRCGSGAVKTMI
jgi:hypothetical protein